MFLCGDICVGVVDDDGKGTGSVVYLPLLQSGHLHLFVAHGDAFVAP